MRTTTLFSAMLLACAAGAGEKSAEDLERYARTLMGLGNLADELIEAHQEYREWKADPKSLHLQKELLDNIARMQTALSAKRDFGEYSRWRSATIHLVERIAERSRIVEEFAGAAATKPHPQWQYEVSLKRYKERRVLVTTVTDDLREKIAKADKIAAGQDVQDAPKPPAAGEAPKADQPAKTPQPVAVLTLNDGTKIQAFTFAALDDTYLIKDAAGKQQKIKKADVKDVERQ